MKTNIILCILLIGLIILVGCTSVSTNNNNTTETFDCGKGIFESYYDQCKRLCEMEDSPYDCRILCRDIQHSFQKEDFKEEVKYMEETCIKNKKCPISCEDSNICTEDYCDKSTNYKCAHKTVGSCVEPKKETIEPEPGAKKQLYDDFSSGILDQSKWQEIPDSENQPLTEEHYVNSKLQNYYVANYNKEYKRTILNLIGHEFQQGETLEYDVDYISGTGNRAIVIFVNGAPLDATLERNWGGGSIGHNGQDFLAGNGFGKHHITIKFEKDGINILIIKPDNSVYFESITSKIINYASSEYKIEPPFKIGFETWSNGSIQANYDNFYIWKQ